MKFRETSNWKLMAKVKAEIVDGTRAGTRDAAEKIKDVIQEHWSASSPSQPYAPPAEESGNLDSAIMVSDQGRDDSGRFSGANTASFFVTANAPDGSDYHGRGNYAIPLELGRENADPRPFMAPAVQLVSEMLPNLIEARVKK